MNQTDKSPRQRANAEGGGDEMKWVLPLMLSIMSLVFAVLALLMKTGRL